MTDIRERNLQAALAFLEKWPAAKFFPARRIDGEHKPLVKWGTTTVDDPEGLRTWAAKYEDLYFCVALKASGLVAIDADDKNGKRGSDVLTALEAEHGPLPRTLMSKTPSVGSHRVLSGSCAQGANKLGPGVDLPGMIPVPGSIVPGKGAYKIVDDAPITALPEWVVTLAGKPRERDSGPAPQIVLANDAHDLLDARRWLAEEAPPSIQNKGGDKTAIDVVHHLWDKGIDQGSMLPLLLDAWNDRCEPPWTIDELVVKIENGCRYAKEPFGSKSTPVIAGMFSPIPDEPSPTMVEPRPFHITDLSTTSCEFVGLTCPPPMKMVFKLGEHGGLPQNIVGFNAAAGGTGKSFLWLQVACSIVSGENLCGAPFQFPTRGGVLYISCEDAGSIRDDRLFKIRRLTGTPLDLKNLHVVCVPHLDTRILEKDRSGNLKPTRNFLDLIAFAKTIPDLALIILDPLSRFFAGESNADTDATLMISMFERLREESGATVIVTAHVGKASATVDSEKKLDVALHQNALRGSSGFVDGARWLMTMVTLPPRLAEKLGCNVDDGEQVIAWRVAKSNYSATTNRRYLKRNKIGTVEPIYPSTEALMATESIMSLVDEIAASSERLTRRTARDTVSRKLGVTRNEAVKLIELALAMGSLTELEDRDANNRPRKYLAVAADTEVDFL